MQERHNPEAGDETLLKSAEETLKKPYNVWKHKGNLGNREEGNGNSRKTKGN